MLIEKQKLRSILPTHLACVFLLAVSHSVSHNAKYLSEVYGIAYRFTLMF